MHASNMPTAGNNIPSPKRLKNEARKIRLRDPQLSQSAALDRAANARGLPSYKVVERAWRSRDRASSAHMVTLTATWDERGRGDWGRIAYFSDRGRLFQADRGRRIGVAVAALGKRAGTGVTVS